MLTGIRTRRLEPKTMSISATLSRADEVLAERTRRELARLKAEDAAAEVEAIERARADSFRRIEVAAKYQNAFAAFGEQVSTALKASPLRRLTSPPPSS